MNALLLALALVGQSGCGPRGCPAPPRQASAAPQTAPEPAGNIGVHDSYRDVAVRIKHDPPDGSGYSLLSGTIVKTDGDRGLVLTAGHLAHDYERHRDRPVGRLTVYTVTGKQYTGRYLGHSPEPDDLAAVGIVGEIPPQTFANLAANQPQKAFMLGFASNGRLRGEKGPYVGSLVDVARYKFHIEEGDSGAGVWDDRGDLVGVATAYETHQPDIAVVVPVGRVRGFLATPACFNWFRRRRPSVIINAPTPPNIIIGPTPPPVVVTPPINPAPEPRPEPPVVVPTPAPAFDPTAILQRIGALESQMGSVATTLTNLAAATNANAAAVKQPITFVTPGPQGPISVQKRLGETLTMNPYSLPTAPEGVSIRAPGVSINAPPPSPSAN